MKQAIIVPKDVKMDKGKLCAQVAHASVSAALKVKAADPKLFDKWFVFGQKKVVLKVDNTKQLLELRKKAASFKIQSELIQDAGLTQLVPGTITALGIGPAEDEDIDRVIGGLKLL
jgi:PTH2 family peptidyl-tRNA hydrolase